MITVFLLIVFVVGYLAIALEHPLNLNKAASALITGILFWTIEILQSADKHLVTEQLLEHLGDISSILFFLMGAMTIVELIDAHDGFQIIKDTITTTSKSKLIIIVSVLTFFLSALLDNLTTAIVMTSLCARLLNKKEDKLWFAGMIVIAANAGGAWSPLGDVTTTMLWIGGQITAMNIICKLIIPSLGVCLLPMLIIAYKFRGQTFSSQQSTASTDTERREGKIILIAGVALLLFVPLFKTVTHLPPFMGMMLSLGLIWVIITFLHKKKPEEFKKKYAVAHALQKIDTPSILFFLGILLAVSALQSYGLLIEMAEHLSKTLHSDYLIGAALGLISAIVDNVPLVAAAQGMYSLSAYPTDHQFWEFIALTTGTGGSAIIIGSAAGIAVMGIEQVEFMWYLKKISWLALLGFAFGILLFIAQQKLF